MSNKSDYCIMQYVQLGEWCKLMCVFKNVIKWISVSLLMFSMFVVMVGLFLCKTYC